MKRSRKSMLRKRKIFLSRSLDLLLTTICSLILVYHVYHSVHRLYIGQTKLISDVQPTNKVVFPAFTVCPTFASYSFNEEVFQAFNTSKRDFVFESNFKNNGSDPRYIFLKATYELTEILQFVELQFITEKIKETNIRIRPGDESKYAHWTQMSTVNFGRCYELKFTNKTLKSPIMSIIFRGYINFYVFIHHPGQYHHIDTATKIIAKIKMRTYVDTTYEISNTESTNPNCKSKMDYDFSGCINNETNKKLVDTFGCSVPFLDNSDQSCISDNSTFVESLNKMFKLLIRNAQFSLCGMPCVTIDVFMGLPNYDNDNSNQSFTKIYLRTGVRVKTSTYDYTFFTMIAEVGGTSGLLLGISLIHIFINAKNFVLWKSNQKSFAKEKKTKISRKCAPAMKHNPLSSS